MNCPYFLDKGKKRIICRRGFVTRTILHKSNKKMDQHIWCYCMDKYTRCSNYFDLEKDWGKANGK